MFANFFQSIQNMNGYQWTFVALTNLTTAAVTWNRTCAYHEVGFYAAEEDQPKKKSKKAKKAKKEKKEKNGKEPVDINEKREAKRAAKIAELKAQEAAKIAELEKVEAQERAEQEAELEKIKTMSIKKEGPLPAVEPLPAGGGAYSHKSFIAELMHRCETWSREELVRELTVIRPQMDLWLCEALKRAPHCKSMSEQQRNEIGDGIMASVDELIKKGSREDLASRYFGSLIDLGTFKPTSEDVLGATRSKDFKQSPGYKSLLNGLTQGLGKPR